MKKYFLLQCKRLWRHLPGALIVTLVLLVGLSAVLQLLTQQQLADEENVRFRIGVVGYTDDPFLQMGMTALSSYDSSRFSMELINMTRQEAERAMSLGQLSAYVEVPEEFVAEAMYGRILPLKFVSTVGATGMISIFQTEITDTISQILLDSQKGVYGMNDAAGDHGVYQSGSMDKMALKYAEFAFSRDKTYRVEVIGIGDGLDFGQYLLCGFSVMFLLLSCLPYAPQMIRRDVALPQMLAARGRSAFWQTVCDFGAFLLAMLVMLLVVTLAVALVLGELAAFVPVILQAVPAVVLAAALSYLLYSLSTDLVGGLLMQFFVTLAMCFVSGCMFPADFFPTAVQQFAAWLPTGVARSQIAGALTDSGSWQILALNVAYSLVLFLAGSFVSCRRIREVHR